MQFENSDAIYLLLSFELVAQNLRSACPVQSICAPSVPNNNGFTAVYGFDLHIMSTNNNNKSEGEFSRIRRNLIEGAAGGAAAAGAQSIQFSPTELFLCVLIAVIVIGLIVSYESQEPNSQNDQNHHKKN